MGAWEASYVRQTKQRRPSGLGEGIGACERAGWTYANKSARCFEKVKINCDKLRVSLCVSCGVMLKGKSRRMRCIKRCMNGISVRWPLLRYRVKVTPRSVDVDDDAGSGDDNDLGVFEE